MDITVSMVKELRDKTNAGMMDCKQALSASKGDLEKSVEYLRKKGLSAATKRSSRAVKDGMVASYIHMNGKIGVMVEVNCETDFVAKTDSFRTMVKDIAMHIAATNPTYLKADDIPEDIMAREKGIYREQALAEGKPEKIIDRIIDGKIKKFYEEVCLLDQKFVKDMDITIQTLVNNTIANTGENIVVRRFSRFQLGEDL
ncbi:MAG: translation elongation factor Ts [Thermodesulfobacteriota bacterium]|nr:translation elongation factor Ts [Thermodesulfobacteriota bacterium]